MNTKTKNIVLNAAIFGITVLPLVTLAQVGGAPPTVNGDITSLGQIIVNKVWIVFTIIAIIMFVIAGILFMTAQGSAEKVAQARQAFLWGIAGVAVGILAYTIVTIVGSLLH